MSRLTLGRGHPATVGDALSVILPEGSRPRLRGFAYDRVGLQATSGAGYTVAPATPEWLRCCDDRWNSSSPRVATWIVPTLVQFLAPLGIHA